MKSFYNVIRKWIINSDSQSQYNFRISYAGSKRSLCFLTGWKPLSTTVMKAPLPLKIAIHTLTEAVNYTAFDFH